MNFATNIAARRNFATPADLAFIAQESLAFAVRNLQVRYTTPWPAEEMLDGQRQRVVS